MVKEVLDILSAIKMLKILEDELLEKCNETWEKVKNNLKKEFDSASLYNEKYVKAKIKCCNGKISINFHDNKIPRESSQVICLSVILIDSVSRKGKKYYLKIYIFNFCLSIYKINMIKNTKKRFEKKHAKNIKIFLKKKNKKMRQYHREHNKNLSEEGKEKKVEYMRNYYLVPKKNFFS